MYARSFASCAGSRARALLELSRAHARGLGSNHMQVSHVILDTRWPSYKMERLSVFELCSELSARGIDENTVLLIRGKYSVEFVVFDE